MQWLATTTAGRVAASHEDALDTLLRRRRRPGRDDARPAPGARRRRRGRAGEARRLPARLPRRHDPSIHARGHARARPARGVPGAAVHAGPRAGRDHRRRADPIADFGHLPVRCPFIALMPQWDFLDFLAGHARRYPGFALRMSTGVVGLIDDGGRVVGVSATAPDGPLEVRADLVVGADGRDSTVRAAAGLRVETLGAPMDVLWFRLPRKPGDAGQLLGRVEAGRIFIMLDRGDYWQCGFVIAKGTLDEIRARGLA